MVKSSYLDFVLVFFSYIHFYLIISSIINSSEIMDVLLRNENSSSLFLFQLIISNVFFIVNVFNSNLLKKFMNDSDYKFTINGINLIMDLVTQISGKSPNRSIIYSKLFNFS